MESSAAETAHPRPERSVGGWGSLVIVNPNASQVRDAATRSAVIADVERALARRDGVTPASWRRPPRLTHAPRWRRPSPRGSRPSSGSEATARCATSPSCCCRPRRAARHRRGRDRQPAGGRPGPAAQGGPVGRRRPGGRRTRGPSTWARSRVRLVDGPERQDVFTIGCGVGFDARLMATTPRDWKQRLGKAAYFVQAVTLAASIDVVPYRIDGRRRDLRDRRLRRPRGQHRPAGARASSTCACRSSPTMACSTSSSSARAGPSTA